MMALRERGDVLFASRLIKIIPFLPPKVKLKHTARLLAMQLIITSCAACEMEMIIKELQI
jgi:hypothetical protein